ncbi:hypothetical protein EBL_c08280 [Shimwellia blattae DSM 4481 = NBRC 105725]|uniref:Uncharacterized protein n=1 Tax=Shimwellia blattae (strain ATCC 29907 / DSM 4481 / JCM 1650 / NBRC 105725 / CDC 9005-74) TaxID=630626 RepID=I2B5Z4_SHIBC|nr:hypothetical protein EBL_c08280 [Shimwellia blattae DSM 4481 = NBRC 105725]
MVVLSAGWGVLHIYILLITVATQKIHKIVLLLPAGVWLKNSQFAVVTALFMEIYGEFFLNSAKSFAGRKRVAHRPPGRLTTD